MTALNLGRRLAPPRFLLFLALLAGGFFAYEAAFHPPDWANSLAMAFDLAAAIFVLSLIPLLRERGAQVIRRHADANDANRVLVLVVTSLLTVVVMAAIAGELPAARAGDMAAAARLVATLVLIWLFANSVYALHYAHDWYLPGKDGGDAGGIAFPGTPEPAYGDFVYFAFTLGMTFQTSDCDITSRRIRGITVLHSLAAYVYSIGVIAFTINAISG
ncbi:MAG: DUF1345 domain-containing protein [Novosphingobium sp.]